MDRTLRGLYNKYIVLHLDGTPTQGHYFILKPETDKAAVEALKSYAHATQNEQLAEDLWQWIKELEKVLAT